MIAKRLSLFVALIAIAAPMSAQTISTPAPQRQIGMFNNIGNSSFGQSIVAPDAVNSLDSFRFWLNPHGDTQLWNPNIKFRAYVMRWDVAGERATGSVLWESDTRTGTGQFDFATGGVQVTSGQSYILFLSTTAVLDQMQGNQYGVLMGYGFNDYTNGRFYSAFNGGDFGLLSSGAWNRDGGCSECDAAFSASFSSREFVTTPEPSTYGLTAAGVIMVMALRRRRALRI